MRAFAIAYRWNKREALAEDYVPALAFWEEVQAIPAALRPGVLLDAFGADAYGVSQLWGLATGLMRLPEARLLDELGFVPTVERELARGTPGAARVYAGAAGVSPLLEGVSRFKKVFLALEERELEEADAAGRPENAGVTHLGRVVLGGGAYGFVADGVLPLYFRGRPCETTHSSNEAADLVLDYTRASTIPPAALPPSETGVSFDDDATREELVPSALTWPSPREPLFPFDGLHDYLRVVGPGVLVGRGWRDEYPERGLRSRGKPFLDFVLVREDDEDAPKLVA